MEKETDKIKGILEHYPSEQRFMLAVMHDIQNEYGYISADHIKAIADYLGVSTGEIFADLTFYDAFTTEKQGGIVIRVCDGTVCHSEGNKAIIEELEQTLGIKAGETTRDGTFTLKTVNCMGACGNAPVVGYNEILYGNLDQGDCGKLTGECRKSGFNPNLQDGSSINLLDSGFETVLLNSADSIDSYMEQGGYKGLKKALEYPKRRDVIEEVKESGLRGRSGSGFPVGLKWQGAYNIPGQDRKQGIVKDKFVVANGDEGDPGAFMDRWVMEENPYAVIEGLIIAGYAVKADKGYIYIRDEYSTAIDRVRTAIEETKDSGFLGKNILETDFGFDCEIVRAAGSYVCGEEGALMESIEGKPGIPRIKPPLPTAKGVLGQPTIVNNVETLANIPVILKKGGKEYAKIGLRTCTGTKLISLAGKVKNKGLVEIPMGGVTLRQLIYDIGGGMEDERHPFKCIQTGGPSGGFITEKNLDLPLDFDSMKRAGSLLGSGGIVVMDDTICAVDMAKYMVGFLAQESCGTCTPCREGIRCMLQILTAIIEGRGDMEDLILIEDIAFAAAGASRCALGKAAANPVMMTLKYFRDEYEEHIGQKKCRAGVCAMCEQEQEV